MFEKFSGVLNTISRSIRNELPKKFSRLAGISYRSVWRYLPEKYRGGESLIRTERHWTSWR